MTAISGVELAKVEDDYGALVSELDGTLFDLLEHAGFDVDDATELAYRTMDEELLPQLVWLNLDGEQVAEMAKYLALFFMYALWCGHRAGSSTAVASPECESPPRVVELPSRRPTCDEAA